MKTIAPELRLDRIQLRSPAWGADGSLRVSGVLVSVGDRLEYAWGTETVTRDALDDREYLDGLVGLSIVRQQDHTGEVSVARDGKGRAVGHVVAARLEGDSVVVDMAITDPEAAREVSERRMVSLSEGYRPTLDGDKQVKRRSNHIALVQRGRSPSARIQLDAGGHTMTEEQIKAAIAEAATRAATAVREQADEAQRFDALQAERDKLQAERDALQVRVDAAEQRIAAVEDAALVERARALGLSLPTSSKPATRLRDIAGLIRSDLRSDASDEYLRGVIDAAQPPARQLAAASHTPRADAADAALSFI